MKKVLYLAITLVILMSSSMVVFGQENDYESSWAKNEINYMKDKSIISVYQDGTFRPDNNMNKSEFYKVVNSIMGFIQKSEINFNDVGPENWYYDEVKKGVGANYILSGTSLNAEENITRGEVARIIGIIFGIEEDKSEASKFEDGLTLPEELKGVIGGLKKNGYINGYPDGTFRANAVITRAEVVKILYDISGEIVNEAGNINNNINKNLIVNTADVTLKDMTIGGNLYLAEGIGEGNLVLDNVIVKGKVIVNGGGPNSLSIMNSQLNSIFVDKKQGLVNMVLSNTKVGEVKTVKQVRLELTQGSYVKKLELKDEANIISAKDTSIDNLRIISGDIVIDSKGIIKYIKSENQFKVNGSILKANVEYKVVDGKLEELNKTAVSATNKPALATLKSISIKSLPDKVVYEVGDTLNITGLIVEGIYSDGSRKTEIITKSDISGFNSRHTVKKQVLTIKIGGKTATFTIDILESESKIDKSKLVLAIVKARLKNIKDYTEESWIKFEKALEKSVKVNGDKKATQEEVNQALSELNATMDGLKSIEEPVDPKVDKTALSAAIEAAITKKENDYTEESWTQFAEALEKAVKVNGDIKATQEESNQALSELNATMDGLKLIEEPVDPKVDKTALSAAIEVATTKKEKDYTEESWRQFTEALNTATELNKDEEATQEEINQALSELNAAINGLEVKEEPVDPEVDKTALSSAIEEAMTKNEEDYTEESWRQFAEALETAKEVNEDEEAAQEEVNQALSELNAAMDALEVKEEPSDPDITNIMPNEDISLNVGDILEVSFNAPEGGNAYFRLLIPPNAHKNRTANGSSDKYKVEMTETEPGFYSTTWSAIKGINARNLKVEVNFESKEGNKAYSIAKGRVNIILDDPEIDKTELAAVIAEAMTKNEEDYTEESWRPFAEALETAIEVNRDEEAAQEEVNQALSELNAAMNALVEKEKPNPEIIATFHPSFMPTFGKVSVQVQNIARAAKFDVVYHLSDSEDGSENIQQTDIVALNQQTGLIFYNPAQYNTVTIRIYDENEAIIYVFTDVLPVRK